MKFTNEQLLNIISNFSKYKGEYNVKYFNYRNNATMSKAKFKDYVFKMQDEVINKITKGEKTDDLLAKFFVLKNINGNEVVNYTDKLCELYSITKDELNKLGNIYNHPANYYSVNKDSYIIKYDNLEKDGITVTNKPVIIPNEIKEEEPSNKSIFDEEQIPEEIENVEPVQKNYITLTTNDLNSTIKEYNTYFNELKNDSTKDISSEDLLKEANNKINSGKIGLSSENDYKLLAKAILYLRANNNGILKGTFSKAFNIGPRQLDELVQVVRANSHLDKIYDDITIDGDGHYSNHSLKEKNEKVKEYIDKNKYNQDLLGKNPLNMDKSDIFAIYSDVCSLDDSDLTTLKSVYSASRDYMQNKSFLMRYPSKFNAKIKGLASIVSMNLKNRFDLNKNSDLLEVLGINKKQLESLSKVIDYFKNNSVENIGDISISNEGNIVCDDKLLGDINNFTLNRKNILEERLNIKQQENKEVEEKVSTVSNEENKIENDKEEVKVETTSALNNKNIINENDKEKNIMNLSPEQISKLAQEDKKLKDSFTLDLKNNNPSQKTITFKTLIKDFKNKLEKDSKENKTIENYIDLFAKYSFYKAINNRDTAEDLEDLLKEHFNLKKEDLEELTDIYEKSENLVPVIEENKIEEEKEVIVEENEAVEENEVIEEKKEVIKEEVSPVDYYLDYPYNKKVKAIRLNDYNFNSKNLIYIVDEYNQLNGLNVNDILDFIKDQINGFSPFGENAFGKSEKGTKLLAAAFKLRDLNETEKIDKLEEYLYYGCGLDKERLDILYDLKNKYQNKEITNEFLLHNYGKLEIKEQKIDLEEIAKVTDEKIEKTQDNKEVVVESNDSNNVNEKLDENAKNDETKDLFNQDNLFKGFIPVNTEVFNENNLRYFFEEYNNLNGASVDDIENLISEQKTNIHHFTDAHFDKGQNGTKLIAAAYKLKDLNETEKLNKLEDYLLNRCGIDKYKLKAFYELKDKYFNKETIDKFYLGHFGEIKYDVLENEQKENDFDKQKQIADDNQEKSLNEVADNGETNKEEQMIENDVTESSNDIQSNNDNEIEIEENYPEFVVLNRDWFYRKNFKDIFKAFNNLNGYNVDDIVRVIKEQEKTIAKPSDAQYINKGNGSLLLAAAFKLRDLGENKILKDLETFLAYNCGIDDVRLDIFYKIKDEYANKKIDKKIVLNNNNDLGIDNEQVDEKEDYIDTELIEEDQFSKYRAHNNTEFQKVNFLITDLINNTTNHKYNVAEFDEVYEKISNEIKDKVKNKSDIFDRTVSGLSAGYRMIAFYFALTALKNEAQKTLKSKESIIKEIDHAKQLVSGDMDYLISKTENFIKNPYFIGFPTGNFNLLKSSFKNNQLPDRNDIKRVLDNTEPNKYIEYNVNETKLRHRFDSDFTLLLNTEHIKAMSNYYNEYLDLNLNHEELEKKFDNLMENLNYPTFKNGAFNSLNDASLKALPMLIILSKYRIDSWVKEQYNKFEKVGLSSEQLETAITLIKGFRKFRFPNNDKFIEVNSSGKIYSNLDDDGVYFRQIDFTGNYIKHDSEVSEHEDIARDIKSFEQISKEDKANIEEEMAMEYQNSIEEFRDKTRSSKENPKGLITGPEKLSKALSILAIHKGVYNEMFKEKNIFQKIGTWFSKKARNCRAEIKEMNNFFKNNNIDPNEYIDMSNKETFTNDNKVEGFFKNYAEENKDALSKFGILENKKENTQKVQSLNIDWNKYVSNEQESMEIKVNTSIKEINSLENDNYKSK